MVWCSVRKPQRQLYLYLFNHPNNVRQNVQII